MDNQTVEFTYQSQEEAQFVISAAQNTAKGILEINKQIRQLIPSGWMPKELGVAQARSGEISSLGYLTRDSVPLPCTISVQTIPFLKWSIECELEKIVVMQEKTAQLTHDEEPQLAFKKKLQIGSEFLRQSMFDGVESIANLSLSNYFNLETVTRIQGADAALQPRIFDEKFHILVSQSLFLADLRYFRIQCALRNRPVSVAYIDIDEFKKFNNELEGKETQVDRDILPRFMSALEGFVFGRGYAYREGGDEYLVILPSASHDEAAVFFDSLRQHLESIKYPISIPGPTVSIGVCTADTMSRITALQIQMLANKAKAFAKKEGRNRVAVYKSGEPHGEKSLIILSQSLMEK